MNTHQLLSETIDLFIEYRDKHGHDEAAAKTKAVADILEGINPGPIDAALESHGAALQEMPSINAQLDALNSRCEWDKQDCQVDWQTRERRKRYESLLKRASELETALGY